MSGEPTASQPGRSRPLLRKVLYVVAALGGTALAVEVLLNSSDELLAAADDLTDIQPLWVVVACVAEAVCYLSRGAAQRRLLVSAQLPAGARRRQAAPATADSRTANSRTADSRTAAVSATADSRTAASPADDGGGEARPTGTYPRARTVVLAGTTLAGDALAYCLPLGFAAAGVVSLRVLRRRGVGQIVAGWMFGVATLLYIAVLAVLAVIAAQFAGDNGPAGLQTLALVLLVAVVVALAAVVVLTRLPTGTAARLLRPIRDRLVPSGRTAPSGRIVRVVRAALRATGRAIASWWAETRRLRLGPAALALASLGMLVSWLADIGVLALSYVALGATPPWTGLLLAYCAGQVVSSVPLTPGGIGVVEGSLTLALVAFGGSTETTLAAVLLYRLISHWACIPVGGLAWLGLRFTAGRDADDADDADEVGGSAADPATSSGGSTPTITDVAPLQAS